MRDKMCDIRVYFQPAFLICVVVLSMAGAGMSIAMKKLGVLLEKEPLPLKKSLDILDDEGLAPYQVISKQKIENKEIVKELGTDDYIKWVLEDTDAAVDSAVRKCMLFITYYRLPDRVPHVPEECYAGSGFQRLASDGVTLNINNNAGFERKIPARHLVFVGTTSNFWQSEERFPVLYLFRVNGEYAGSREEARLALNKNLFRKSSYFSKVEVVFSQGSIAPRKEKAVEASEKLLAVILPILEAEHWPDW